MSIGVNSVCLQKWISTHEKKNIKIWRLYNDTSLLLLDKTRVTCFTKRASCSETASLRILRIIPCLQVLEGLLKKLEIEHVVWCADKNSSYYQVRPGVVAQRAGGGEESLAFSLTGPSCVFPQVFFPVESGDDTENCLHSLTELKIGKKHNSVVR